MEDWLAITDELERRTSLRQARTASHYELPNEEASSGGSSSTHPYSSSYARPVQPTKAPTQGPVGGIQEPDSAPASPAMPPPPPPHKPPGKMKAQDERHKPSRASPAELLFNTSLQIPPTSEELRETLRDSGTLAGKGWQPPLQIRTSSSQPSLSAARQFGILKPVQNAFHDLPLLPPKSPRRRTSSQSSQQELPSSSPALGSLIGSFPSPMRRKRTSLDKKSLPATPSSQQRSSHASSTRFNTAKDLPSRGLRRLTLTPAAAPTPAPSPAHHNKSQSLGILPSSAAQLAASLDIPRDALQPMLDASHAVWRTHAQEGGKSSRQRLRSTSQPRETASSHLRQRSAGWAPTQIGSMADSEPGLRRRYDSTPHYLDNEQGQEVEVLVDEDSALEAERRRSVNFSRPMPHQPMRQCASSVGLGVMAEREAQLPKQIANGHLSAAARGHLHAWSVEIDAEGVPHFVSRPSAFHAPGCKYAGKGNATWQCGCRQGDADASPRLNNKTIRTTSSAPDLTLRREVDRQRVVLDQHRKEIDELRKAISRLESSATSTYASAQSSAAGSEAFLEAIIAVPSLPAQRSTDHPPSTSYTRTQYAQHTRDESNSNSSRSGTQTPESTLDHFFGTPRKRWGSASTYGTSVSDGSVEHVQQVLQSLAQAQAGQIQMKMPGSPPTPRRKSSLRHVGSCGDMLMFPIREQNEVSSLQSRQSHQSLQSTSNYSTNTASKTNSHDFAAGAAGGIRASPKSPPPPRPASQISTATTATGTSIAIKGRHQNQQRNTADSSLTILGFGKAI